MVKLAGEWEYPIYFGAGPELFRLASELRKSLTPAEKILWEKLRRKQIMGLRFRRQHPIDHFIADFFCYEAKLFIEIDGTVHDDDHQRERDVERTIILNRLGLREIRYKNEEVLLDIDDVVRRIEIELNT